MFVVTVNFVIKKDHIDEFEPVMKKQARNSLRDEAGCLRFDVCSDPKDRSRIFLYELYESADAFALHLKTKHFLDFDKTVKDWTKTKVAENWQLLDAEV